MSWREAVDRMVTRILPWPRRSERKAAIARARRSALQSRHEAASAKVLTRDLERIARQNHFAESIARQLREGRSRG